MAKVAEHTAVPAPPFQIKMTRRYDKATAGEKNNCIERAEEACRTVSSVIVPNDEETL